MNTTLFGPLGACLSFLNLRELARNTIRRFLTLVSLIIATSVLSVAPLQADFTASNRLSNTFFNQCFASRFLAEASMGGTVEEITALGLRIGEIGHIPACEEWIDNQFALPRGDSLHDQCREFIDTYGPLYGTNPSHVNWYRGWWNMAIRTEEQLRCRMAFALSQICVTSSVYWNGLYRSRWLRQGNYYDLLLDNAFTNHRALLQDITWNSFMGVWLSNVQNAPADPVLGTFPDENYAREVLQLFSMGVYELDAWGNYVTDSEGNPIENYDNSVITEFAEVFTGLSIDDQRGFFKKDLTIVRNPVLEMKNKYHDKSTKVLLNGTVLPAGQNGTTDISQALDNIAEHPSTAPNFSRLLIKRFTSSNPSPEYTKRVTDAWYGNGPYGTGVVGDFKAVLKAILLDPEVRDAMSFTRSGNLRIAVANNEIGSRIKEPILKMTQFYRFANPQSGTEDGHVVIDKGGQSAGPRPLTAATVFNFYDAEHAPSYGPIGQYVADYETNNPGMTIDLTSPEAQILGQNVIAEFEKFYDLVLADRTGTSGENVPVLEELNDISFGRNINVLRFLDIMLCHGQIPNSLNQDLLDHISPSGGASAEGMAELLSIIYASPAYSVTF